MNEIATRPAEVLNPVTGEIIALDSPTDQLGLLLAQVRDLEGDLRLMKNAVAAELLHRMDHEAKWTVRAGGLEISGDGPGRVEYDADQLHAVLDELVGIDRISQGAADAACEPQLSYKVRAAGITALRKLGADVATRLDEIAQPIDHKRRVRVTKA